MEYAWSQYNFQKKSRIGKALQTYLEFRNKVLTIVNMLFIFLIVQSKSGKGTWPGSINAAMWEILLI